MLRPILASLLVALTLAGCQAPPAAPSQSPTDVRPRVSEEARWWEQQGDKELARAYLAPSYFMKKTLFDAAIRDLKHARDLYYGELDAIEKDDFERQPPPSPGRAAAEVEMGKLTEFPSARRQMIELEIERLTSHIVRLHVERPYDRETHDVLDRDGVPW